MTGSFSAVARPHAVMAFNLGAQDWRGLTDHLFIAPHNLVTLPHDGGNRCFRVDSPSITTERGDGLVTATPDLALGITTSPGSLAVLFNTIDARPLIGAVHVTPENARRAALEFTLDAMRELYADRFGADLAPARIAAVIGHAPPNPVLTRAQVQEYYDNDPASIWCFKPAGDGMVMDMAAYCRHRLTGWGVRRIETLKGQGGAGRAAIALPA